MKEGTDGMKNDKAKNALVIDVSSVLQTYGGCVSMELKFGQSPNSLLCLSLPEPGIFALKSSLTTATTQPHILGLHG